jgi:four helix bundle suffix protein
MNGRWSSDRMANPPGPDPTPRPAPERSKRLRASGGYRELRSFQVATIIYDATVAFCGRFIDSRSRTKDQMVQAARSGRQNIAEGTRAAATSSQTELRLVNVARASLVELLLDYEDFLRQRNLALWHKNSTEAREVRGLGSQPRSARRDLTDPTDPLGPGQADVFGPYAPWLNHSDPAIAANTVICLIHQANYLLDQQIAALERAFISDGGYTERLAAERIAERERRRAEGDPAVRPDSALPNCPLCGKPMAMRTARKGKNAGSQFWGCSAYPACKGTQPADNW